MFFCFCAEKCLSIRKRVSLCMGLCHCVLSCDTHSLCEPPIVSKQEGHTQLSVGVYVVSSLFLSPLTLFNFKWSLIALHCLLLPLMIVLLIYCSFNIACAPCLLFLTRQMLILWKYSIIQTLIPSQRAYTTHTHNDRLLYVEFAFPVSSLGSVCP